jgi:hypothetical protein
MYVLCHLSSEDGNDYNQRARERTSFHRLMANKTRDRADLVELRVKKTTALKRNLGQIIVYCRPIYFSLSFLSFEDRARENVINNDGSSNWRDDDLYTDIMLLYLD